FYAELNLRKWAHMLAFRGHFLTKSKHYSTTFKRIREDRRAYRAAEVLDRLGLAMDDVIVVNDWAYAGSGYANDAERELASGIAERLRAQRQRQYTEEDAA
ncbi:replication initiation protein, partial [Saccharothrix sp. MB29]|nr:replication initiation protein [Saccharothrix sp. MB29]